MSDQLRYDLEKRIQGKLRTWMRDSFDLYRMADLEPSEATADIFCALVSVLVAGAATFKFDPEMLTDIIRRDIERARVQYNKMESKLYGPHHTQEESDDD